jgi:hypothetical protein
MGIWAKSSAINMCTYIGHLESYNIVGNDKEVSYACCLRGQRSIDVPPK